MAPSEICAMFLACSGVEMPKPMAQGTLVFSRTTWMMESIQAVNKGLEAFPGVVLLASHDHEMLTSTCNRVIAFQPDGTIIDKYGTYDDYLAWMAEQKK